METFFSALAVAAVTAATVVAYRHPLGYRKYAYPALGFLTLIAVVAFGTWNVAILQALSTAVSATPTNEGRDVHRAIQQLRAPDWWLFAMLGGGGFWFALTFLHLLTDERDGKN